MSEHTPQRTTHSVARIIILGLLFSVIGFLVAQLIISYRTTIFAGDVPEASTRDTDRLRNYVDRAKGTFDELKDKVDEVKDSLGENPAESSVASEAFIEQLRKQVNADADLAVHTNVQLGVEIAYLPEWEIQGEDMIQLSDGRGYGLSVSLSEEEVDTQVESITVGDHTGYIVQQLYGQFENNHSITVLIPVEDRLYQVLAEVSDMEKERFIAITKEQLKRITFTYGKEETTND